MGVYIEKGLSVREYSNRTRFSKSKIATILKKEGGKEYLDKLCKELAPSNYDSTKEMVNRLLPDNLDPEVLPIVEKKIISVCLENIEVGVCWLNDFLKKENTSRDDVFKALAVIKIVDLMKSNKGL